MTTPLQLDNQRRPNVIWIFCDQLRAQALGYRGDTNVATPNIDNLARNGMRFDAACAGAPWCCPFRGALLSGQYPHVNGVTQTPSPLDPAKPTIAQPFAEAGYHTAWVGKWHLDGSNDATHYVPPERRGGFDYWLGYENNNNQHEVHVFGSDCEEPRRLPGYEVDGLADALMSHLRRHVAIGNVQPEGYQPFFACLSVQPPHDPYVAPHDQGQARWRNPASVQLRRNVPAVEWVEDRARLDLCGYYQMVEHIDRRIGRLREELQALDVDQETYLMFFSDHGDMLGSHGQMGKSSPWEESIRIPFLISRLGGGVRMRIGRCDAPINHVDIGPTTLGLCGINAPAWMQGHDYSQRCVPGAEVTTDAEPDSAYLQQIPSKKHRHSVNTPWRGVLMRDGWKYVVTPQGPWLLHDTGSDPYEQANLVFDEAFREQRERCAARLQQWITETGDDFVLR